MLIAAHSISGGVVGEAIGNPFLAILFGFVSHFLLDLIPHFDTTDDGKLTKRQLILIGIDGSIGLAIIVYLLMGYTIDPVSFLAGAFGAIIPDLFDNVKLWEVSFRKSKFGEPFHAFHELVHSNLNINHWKLGAFTQILVILISIFLYLQYVV